MTEALLVVRSFGSRLVGELIEDEGEKRDVTMGEHAHHVVRVLAPLKDIGIPEEF